jgi:hypothetical protein
MGTDYGAMVRDSIEFASNIREKLKNNLGYTSDLDRLQKYVKIARLKKDYE